MLWILCWTLWVLLPVGQASRIAVVSPFSFASPDAERSTQWHCQLHNHEQYCKTHGYDWFMVTDRHYGPLTNASSEWKRLYLSDSISFGPHWFKVYVLRIVLPRYDAVVILDSDVMFQNLSLPLEPYLAAAGRRWWLLPDENGITSFALFLRNTHFSRAVVEYLWDLRHVCPRCPAGEQCALHLVIHKLLIDWALQNGRGHFLVANYRNIPCCNPGLYCEYPSGKREEHYPNFTHLPSMTFYPEGCTWRWWTALNRGPLHPMLHTTHRAMYWVPKPEAPAQTLNLIHPVKQTSKCQALNPAYNASYVPTSTNVSDFRSLMTSRIGAPLGNSGTIRSTLMVHSADVHMGLFNLADQRDFRFCKIFRVKF